MSNSTKRTFGTNRYGGGHGDWGEAGLSHAPLGQELQETDLHLGRRIPPGRGLDEAAEADLNYASGGGMASQFDRISLNVLPAIINPYP
jgi:hypothetical protein